MRRSGRNGRRASGNSPDDQPWVGGGSMWMMASAICGKLAISRSLTTWDSRCASWSGMSGAEPDVQIEERVIGDPRDRIWWQPITSGALITTRRMSSSSSTTRSESTRDVSRAISQPGPRDEDRDHQPADRDRAADSPATRRRATPAPRTRSARRSACASASASSSSLLQPPGLAAPRSARPARLIAERDEHHGEAQAA